MRHVNMPVSLIEHFPLLSSGQMLTCKHQIIQKRLYKTFIGKRKSRSSIKKLKNKEANVIQSKDIQKICRYKNTAEPSASEKVLKCFPIPDAKVKGTQTDLHKRYLYSEFIGFIHLLKIKPGHLSYLFSHPHRCA